MTCRILMALLVLISSSAVAKEKLPFGHGLNSYLSEPEGQKYDDLRWYEENKNDITQAGGVYNDCILNKISDKTAAKTALIIRSSCKGRHWPAEWSDKWLYCTASQCST